MTNKIIYISTVALLLALIGGVAYYSYNAHQSLTERIENQQNLADLTAKINDEAYTACVDEAYAEYTEDWNKQCWANGEQSECLLGLFSRYDVEHDFHEAVIICLAQYK